jgi:hypothetical protein
MRLYGECAMRLGVGSTLLLCIRGSFQEWFVCFYFGGGLHGSMQIGDVRISVGFDGVRGDKDA